MDGVFLGKIQMNKFGELQKKLYFGYKMNYFKKSKSFRNA